MAVFGYIRVSTQEQNDSRQRDALAPCGIPAENLYADRVSGKDFERPGYRRLTRRLRANIYNTDNRDGTFVPDTRVVVRNSSVRHLAWHACPPLDPGLRRDDGIPNGFSPESAVRSRHILKGQGRRAGDGD